MRTIYRYKVPVDDLVHEHKLTGRLLSVANGPGEPRDVEFWAEHDDTLPEYAFKFLVVGTGHPVPEGGTYVGTAPRTREGLVWHLYSWPAKVVVRGQ
jgi:hypothetical protein